MRATVVIEVDPVADDTGCVLDAAEAMFMNALLLERPDHPLDHPVLLRAVRRDDLLLQAIAADDGREMATGEDQPVARSAKYRHAIYVTFGGAEKNSWNGARSPEWDTCRYAGHGMIRLANITGRSIILSEKGGTGNTGAASRSSTGR